MLAAVWGHLSRLDEGVLLARVEGQGSCSTPPAPRKARPSASAPASCGREFPEPGGGGLDRHLSLFLGLLPDAGEGQALSASAPHT